MLNIYLVLSVETSMKADAFVVMVRFLRSHGQLKQVMIKQVQELPKLAEEWVLTLEERYALFTECAKHLMDDGDSTFAFRLYFEAAMLVDVVKGTAKSDKHVTTATGLITSAIKSPAIMNFQEVLQLTIVQELKTKSVAMFNLLQLYTQGEMSSFKKGFEAEKKNFEAQGITADKALLKRQYMQICELKEGQQLSYDELAKMIGVAVDDIEEWIVEASIHGIMTAKIDQFGRQLTIKSTMLCEVKKEQLLAIKDKVSAWKDRFQRIHSILVHQPELEKTD